METIIYLIRHGETEWNNERRFQGQTDIPLNQKGTLQAKLVAQRIHQDGIPFDAIYSSDLARAKETAEIIAAKINMRTNLHSELRERFFGNLQGITIDDIKRDYPEIDMTDLGKYEQFNMEPIEVFKKRIFNAILTISQEHINKSIAIVSHGAAINTFLHQISGGQYGSGITQITNTSITTVIINHKNGIWDIKELNDVSHLEVI